MNVTLQHIRRALKARVVIIFAALAMAMTTTAVVCPVQVVQAQEPSGVASELNQWSTRHDQLGGLLKTLRKDRTALEPKYRTITAQVEKLKRAGSTGLQLEKLLEDGKVLSEKLYSIQKKIRSTENKLNEARERVVALYDMLIAQTHQDVVNPTASDISRSEAIERINTLKSKRYTFASKPEATPDLNITNLRRLMETPIDDPEEAAAQAAEVDDTNRKLQKHIGELDQKISELKRLKQTRTKARDFRDQESFFDEQTVGGRRIARGSEGARSNQGTDTNTNGGKETTNSADQGTVATDNNNSDDFGGEEATGAPPQAETGGGGVPAEDGVDGSFGNGGDEVQEGDSDNLAGGTNDPNITNERNDVGVGSAVGGAVDNVPTVNLPNDPFGGSGIVVRSDAEIEGANGVSGPSANESLDQQIKRLEREKKRNQKESKRLEKRIEQLNKIADE